MTKPLYFYNGTTFELVGPTTPQSPIAYQTSAPTAPATGDLWIDSDGDVDTYNRQLTRYYFVATAGQTSVSGVDANGLTLAYVAGSEAVYVNGALQVRGVDYTATNGTSITGLSALGLNDVVEVFAYTAFTVANAYTKSETDSVAAAATGLRMVVPTSVAVGSGTGSVDAIGNVTFSGASSVSINGCFTSTYDNYRVVISNVVPATGSANLQIRFRASGSDNTTSNYFSQEMLASSTTLTGLRVVAGNLFTPGSCATGGPSGLVIDFLNPFAAIKTEMYSLSNEMITGTGNALTTMTGFFDGTTSFDSFTLIASASTISGTIRVYGYKD